MPRVNVVIPTIGKNGYIAKLVQQLLAQYDDHLGHIFVYDNGMSEEVRNEFFPRHGLTIFNTPNINIYQMWNMGVKHSLEVNPSYDIAILNDDLILDTDNFISKLQAPLNRESNIWGVCGNYDHRESDQPYVDVTGTFKDRGFAGFCFVIPARAFQSGLPLFEERYTWWYGDDELVHNIHKMGYRTVMSIEAKMTHIHGGSNSVVQYTEEFNKQVSVDQSIYYKKWHNHG